MGLRGFKPRLVTSWNKTETAGEHGGMSDSRTVAVSACEVEFPEALVQRILSQIPFPYFYKVRVLSKHWNFKFSSFRQIMTSPSGHGVISACNRWPTYCPAFVRLSSCRGTDVGELVGFDRRSNCWRRFSVHPSIPLILPRPVMSTIKGPFSSSVSKPTLNNPYNLAIGGSLVAVLYKSGLTSIILVTNWVTGEWRLLPCPTLGYSKKAELRLLSTGVEEFKLLLHDYHESCCLLVSQVYDSRSKTWSETTSTIEISLFDRIFGVSMSPYSAYVGENVYCHIKSLPHEMVIMRFNLKDGILRKLVHPSNIKDGKISQGGIFLCNSKLVVTALFRSTSAKECWFPSGHSECTSRARVYEFHPEEFQLTEVSKSPLEMEFHGSGTDLVADSQCLYFIDPPDGDRRSSFTSYNVVDRRWSVHPPVPGGNILRTRNQFSCFHPGQNPFALS